MKRAGLLLLLITPVIVALIYRNQILQYLGNTYFAVTSEPIANNRHTPPANSVADDQQATAEVEIVAENLRIPWEIAFLPDGSLLVTERPGAVVRLLPDDRQSIPIAGVEHVGEGGLLGLVLHPEYQSNRWLYLYHTTQTSSGLINRVERYTFDENTNTLNDRQIILDAIPASSNHDGGRLAFGPDNLLYITTGDASTASLAQNTQSLAGKILRIRDDGSIPEDNPFGTAVFSYGHRNSQGLSWDGQGQLWSTEHGPSGAGSGFDEVNLIERGGNYGWPNIQGSESGSGMISPVIHSGGSETWAPADVEVVDSVLVFPGLRGQALYSAIINGSQVSNRSIHFQNEYGRLRVVTLSPDQEWIYLATSNRDGRGRPAPGDDKIIRIHKQWFLDEVSKDH